MKCRLLLNVVVAQRAAIFQLLAREDQALLVRRNALLVLNLGFDALDSIRRLHINRESLARQSLDENLHFILALKTKPFFELGDVRVHAS